MTKTIMSIAAIAALMTSGAFAFDTNTTGGVLDIAGTPATFTAAEEADSDLRLSDHAGEGDFLIYPAYNQKDTWGTEIVVRNNKDYGVLAKAALYAATDSREVLDFNIYLSANDVCRFTIKDGKVVSTDDSIVVSENIKDDSIHVFASANKPFDSSLAGVELPDAGYVIIYGMAESNITTHGEAAKVALFEEYRATLTENRPNWNDGLNMTNGVYTGTTNPVLVAPHLDNNLTTSSLDEVDDQALSGKVRIYNEEGTTRDVLLNATAGENFTDDGFIMLWAPGEMANLHDRNMVENTAGLVTYEPYEIEEDAYEFRANSAYYTYNNQGATPNVDNKLLITQIFKRPIVQMDTFADVQYWAMRDCAETDGATTGMTFQARGSVWDESENQPETTIGGGLIVSPANSGTIAGYCNELAEISSPEADTDFAERNGYIKYTFGSDGIPAIITQMSASKVGDDYRINWVTTVSPDQDS